MTTSLEEKIKYYKESLDFFDETMEKYKFLLDQGKKSNPFPEEYRKDTFKVEGCQAQVWLVPYLKKNLIYFHSDSDAFISKGMITILCDIFGGNTPLEITKTDINLLDNMNLNILLVEDDEIEKLKFDRALKKLKLNHSVSKASNGEEALQKCKESLPNLILLDLNMPKMNGFEFLSILSVSNKYGPLLIGSMFTISRFFTSSLIKLANFSSVISKPALIMSSPPLSLIVLEIYFPII